MDYYYLKSSRNMKFTIQLGGNFKLLFGLDPFELYTLSATSPLNQVPLYIFTYTTVECNLVAPQMVSKNGECKTFSELLTIGLASSNPGSIEVHYSYTTGEKCEVSTQTH